MSATKTEQMMTLEYTNRSLTEMWMAFRCSGYRISQATKQRTPSGWWLSSSAPAAILAVR